MESMWFTSPINSFTMNTKHKYTTPTTETLELIQETVICGSYDGTDGTETLPLDNDELLFGVPSFNLF